jgi:oxygen-independent coproporphyrinogen-3 oxidase
MCVAVDAGLLAEPGEDVAAELMTLAVEALAAQDLERYEVANYASDPAHRSRHNTAYWTGRDYIGIGPGAHGMLGGAVARAVGIAGDTAATPHAGAGDRVRYSGSSDIERWLMGAGGSVEVLSRQEALREDAMLGLRLTEGIPEALAQAAGVTDALESLATDGLVECREDRWRTTRRGWLLGNEVFGRIWQP